MSSNLKVNTILPSTGTTVTVSGIASVTSSISAGSSITATTFYGSGANLTSLPSQLTLSNNADNRVITGGSGTNLNGEANLTFDGAELAVSGTGIRVDRNGGNPYIDFRSSSTSEAYIYGGTSGLQLFTKPSGGSIAERLRIDSSGQFSLGRTSQITGNGNSSTSVFEQLSNSNYPLALHSAQTNKRGLLIFYATTGAGNAGDPFIACTDNTNNKFQVTSDGTTTIRGNLVMATAGKGIDFSAASGSGSGSDSALLDDYEEGSWSPLWSDATSGGTTTSNNMHGRYTKVGKLVTAHFWTWGLPVQGTNNAMYLQGLPFASGTIGATFHPIGCAFFNMGADNYHNLGLRLANNVTYAPLLFCRKDPGDKTPALFNGFINYYTNFEGTITYLTA